MSYSLCGTSVGNTGVVACDASFDIPQQFYVWNGSKAISAVTGAAFQTFLEASSRLSKNDPDKVFPFPSIQDITDNTAADTTGSLNQGYTQTLIEGKPSYTYKVFANQAQVKNLRKFNGQNVRIVTRDKSKHGWGVKSGVNFVGAQAKIKVNGLRLPTGQNIEAGVVTISISYLEATEMYDDAIFGDITSSSNIKGLVDVTLTEVSHVSNAYKIGLSIETAKLGEPFNVLDQYSATLASAALWVAKTGATYSTTMTITSVTYDATTGTEIVTFDSTLFTALASGAKIKLNLAAPAVLDAADVVDTEGIAIIITKP